MKPSHSIVITTINDACSKALQEFSSYVNQKENWNLVVIGDVSTPSSFDLPGSHYLDIAAQQRLYPKLSRLLPLRHYSRKNIGYIYSLRNFRTDWIIDTDDDNIPLDDFWNDRSLEIEANYCNLNGWTNIYSYFHKSRIWPRGLPLDKINVAPSCSDVSVFKCGIQQSLADSNPDVDAIYRLTHDLPITFDNQHLPMALSSETWSPFNSQNTSFFKELIPLLYLPSFCSFRMTDIWRSFISLRVLPETPYKLVFTNATVYQERNVHNLLKDFEDEIPGYLNNDSIVKSLFDHNIKSTDLSGMVLELVELLESQGYLGAGEYRICEAFMEEIA